MELHPQAMVMGGAWPWIELSPCLCPPSPRPWPHPMPPRGLLQRPLERRGGSPGVQAPLTPPRVPPTDPPMSVCPPQPQRRWRRCQTRPLRSHATGCGCGRTWPRCRPSSSTRSGTAATPSSMTRETPRRNWSSSRVRLGWGSLRGAGPLGASGPSDPPCSPQAPMSTSHGRS